MAFDIIPFGVTEPNFTFGAAGGPAFSQGAHLDNPQYGAAGVIVTIAGAFLLDNFDIIVQTAPEAATTAAADWVNTLSRLNGVTAPGTYRLPITDAVLNRLRLQIVKNAGATDVVWTVRWLADRSLTLN